MSALRTSGEASPGGCAVCGLQTVDGARMSRVVVEGRTLELCRAHAAAVAAAMPETFEDLRGLFVGATPDVVDEGDGSAARSVDAMIRLGSMSERRSPIQRRESDDRRVFPPRVEGRRQARDDAPAIRSTDALPCYARSMGVRRVVFGLGSNLGDRRARIEAAITLLGAVGGLEVVRRSPLYETAPVGGSPQGDYVNGAVLVETALGAREPFDRALAVEAKLGRTRTAGVRAAPRTIDIDVLWIEGERFDDGEVTVPHPRLAGRAVAVRPLVALAPAARAPISGELYADLRQRASRSGSSSSSGGARRRGRRRTRTPRRSRRATRGAPPRPAARRPAR